ncbi:hypothetical protein E4U58_003625 [Claviceps cyperi]|nr:hypothetical protein E4U58_003625 [Claviceps cyperi]
MFCVRQSNCTILIHEPVSKCLRGARLHESQVEKEARSSPQAQEEKDEGAVVSCLDSSMTICSLLLTTQQQVNASHYHLTRRIFHELLRILVPKDMYYKRSLELRLSSPV